MSDATKTVVLTGGTSGVGYATVEALASGGHRVIAVGRDPGRCRAAESSLRERTETAGVSYVAADLSTTREVRRAASEIRRLVGPRGSLDALVNNAALVSTWRMATEEGFEQQFAVNHLAGFLLTHELFPLLERAGQARVVCVSSGSHRGARIRWDDPMFTRGYTTLRAYRQSKLANVLFVAELNRRLAGTSPVRAYAFDPGLARTDIGLKSSSGIEHLVWRLRSRSRRAADPSVPAAALARLATGDKLAAPEEIYRYRDTPVAPDRSALDPVAGARLWALSERLCASSEAVTS